MSSYKMDFSSCGIMLGFSKPITYVFEQVGFPNGEQNKNLDQTKKMYIAIKFPGMYATMALESVAKSPSDLYVFVKIRMLSRSR